MMSYTAIRLLAAVVASTVVVVGCDEGKPKPPSAPTTKATTAPSATADAAKAVRFGKHAFKVGDEYTDTLRAEISLRPAIRRCPEWTARSRPPARR